MAYVIASNIYNRGIKTSNFFTTPFERSQQKLGDELLDSFILDVEKQIIYGEK